MMMNDHSTKKGTLYLVPNTLGKTPQNNTIPDYVLNIIRGLDVLIVENVQSAVRYLQWVGKTVPDYKIDFKLLNKKTPVSESRTFLKPLLKGRDAGLISEAGCPVVADPGSDLIRMAHDRNINVVPLVGPSSILLALMASGMNGQNFAFHGYLPIEKVGRTQAIRELEKESARKNRTQIFMEAPHRNEDVIKDVVAQCRPDTRFCTATNLTLPDEKVISKKISEWQSNSLPSLHKEPTIFLLQAS